MHDPTQPPVSRDDLARRLTAALAVGAPIGPARVRQIVERIAGQLEPVPLLELVTLVETPGNVKRRIEAQLLAERFPTTYATGQTTDLEGETR